MVNFKKEQGGTIGFSFDEKQSIATSNSGTSVTLWYEELVYVPTGILCGCGCGHPENCFPENALMPVTTKSVFEDSDVQSYAGKYTCFVNVALFNRAEVLRQCPKGFAPAVCTEQNGYYTIQHYEN
jgi:hypothetical protein